MDVLIGGVVHDSAEEIEKSVEGWDSFEDLDATVYSHFFVILGAYFVGNLHVLSIVSHHLGKYDDDLISLEFWNIIDNKVLIQHVNVQTNSLNIFDVLEIFKSLFEKSFLLT